jgi:hypothetical protein
MTYDDYDRARISHFLLSSMALAGDFGLLGPWAGFSSWLSSLGYNFWIFQVFSCGSSQHFAIALENGVLSQAWVSLFL